MPIAYSLVTIHDIRKPHAVKNTRKPSSYEGKDGWNDYFPRYDSDNPCLPSGKTKVSKASVDVGEKFHDDITITPQREGPGVTGTVDYTRRVFYVRPYASVLQQDGTYKALEGYAPEDINLTDAQLKDLSDGKDVTVATPDATYGEAGKVLWGFALYMDGGKEKMVLVGQDPDPGLTDETVTVTGTDAGKDDEGPAPAKAELATRAAVKGGYSGWHPEEGAASGGNYNFGSLGDSFDDNIALRGDLPEGGYVEVTAYEPQDGGFDKGSAKVLHNERIRLTDQQTEDLLKNHSVTIDTSDVSADKAGNVYWAVSLCTDAVTPDGGTAFLNRWKYGTSLKELPAVWATHEVGIPEETTKVTAAATPTSTPTSTPVPTGKELAQTGADVSVPGLVAVGLLIAATVLGIVVAKRSRIDS